MMEAWWSEDTHASDALVTGNHCGMAPPQHSFLVSASFSLRLAQSQEYDLKRLQGVHLRTKADETRHHSQY